MTSHPEPTLRAQVEAAATLLATAHDGLYTVPETELSDLMAALLGLRAAAEALAVATAVQAQARGVIGASTATGVAGWVQQRADQAGVQVSGPEATAWQQVTKHVQEPDMGVFADAVTSGQVGVSSAAVLAKELRRIRASVPAATWDACAAVIVAHAAGGASARTLAEVREVVITQYGDDPEHLPKRERAAHACRELSRFRVSPDGLRVARLACDGAYAAIIEAMLEELSAPQPTCTGPDGRPVRDERTAGQRRVDALLDLFRAVTTHPDVAPFGITPTHATGSTGATGSADTAGASSTVGTTDPMGLDAAEADAAEADAADAAGAVAADAADAVGAGAVGAVGAGAAGAVAADADATDDESLAPACATTGASGEAFAGEAPTGGAIHGGNGEAVEGGTSAAVCPWCGVAGGELVRSALASSGSLTRAQVVVTMDYESLRDQCGYGLTAFGQPLSPQTVRAFACDAGVIPMILGAEGAILDQGRASRTATAAQWTHLRQRDKGCTFPGCDRPPGFCQAHHVRHWVRDLGVTWARPTCRT